MAARIAWMVPVILLPLTGLAQTPALEADQAVRARVTEFLQYHVDGNFRKAYEMVAEDTRDEYFTIGKIQIKGFSIAGITFSDNFTKAKVVATISKTVNVAGTDLPVQMPSTTTWKIENGKWVWFNDPKAPWATPMGDAIAAITAAGAPKSDDNGAGGPTKIDDKFIAAAARSILQQVSVDKTELTLAADKPSEGQVVFHNGMPGSVQVQLSVPEVPGFTAKLEQSMVRATTDVPVVFRYEPDGQAERAGQTPDPVTVQLSVQPLNQIFVIRVNFRASK